jgi:hypothetical protein
LLNYQPSAHWHTSKNTRRQEDGKLPGGSDPMIGAVHHLLKKQIFFSQGTGFI